MGQPRTEADDEQDRREVAAEVLMDLSESIWFWLTKPGKESEEDDGS